MSELVPQPAATPDVAPPPRFRFPADYYAGSPDQVRPLFPRWVPVSCGWVALVILLVAFVGGALIVRVGIGNLMDMVLGSMQDELVSMYAKDVTPEARKALENELARLRDDVRTEKTSVTGLDPVMSELRTDVADKQMTAQEVGNLTRTLHSINNPPPKPSAKPEASKAGRR